MKSNFFKNKKILLTGGAGFLGSYVYAELLKKNVKKEDILIPRSKNLDLRKLRSVKRALEGRDIVIHLAAKVGGIGFNRTKPAEMFYDNIMMGTMLMHEAWKKGVEKFVSIGTICAYPKITPIPFKEDNLWDGYPEETNAPYGLAKKMQLVQAQAYREQYGFNAIYLLPVNMYGPGDNFDLESSHVIPALIHKFYTARVKNDKEVVVWGSGRATREFLYVQDAAKGIVLATEKYNSHHPVNLGATFEISIKELANLIATIVGYKGKIVWDYTKPDGQPRRKVDSTRAKKEFGFMAKTSFENGLRKEIDWYVKNVFKTKK